MTYEDIRQRAADRCKQKHPEIYDSMICVGPGSERGFGPPCDECLAAMEQEYLMKRAKGLGKELSHEETNKIKKELGIL